MSTVAYLGPAGTFTETALWQLHRQGAFAGVDGTDEIVTRPVDSPAQALGAVADGGADFAVVAVESSVEGAVTSTHDALATTDGIQVFAETELEIQFSILTQAHSDGSAREASEIRSLATHPVAFQQIRGWVDKHLPGVEFIAASSNGAAAQMVADGTVDAAAAPDAAADLHGLARLATGVADVNGARTRFFAVGKRGEPTQPTGHDRTSVIFHLRNVPGALAGALQEIALRGVDLSRIESRPTRTGLGTYRFHVDMHGHINDRAVAETLRALWLRCEDIRYLGSWPRAGEGGAAANADFSEQDEAERARYSAAAAWVASCREGSDNR